MKLVKGDRAGWEALFSDDELYRFALWRPVPDIVPQGLHLHRFLELSKKRVTQNIAPGQTASRLVSCGLNPSKADAFRNDNTVALEITHAWLWHCSRYTKVNAYAWRDTRPEDMWTARDGGRDIIGLDLDGYPRCDNDQAIRSALQSVKSDGGIALAAWSALVERTRARRLQDIADEVGVQWMCFGVNQDGSPKHTLRQPYGTELVPWRFR